MTARIIHADCLDALRAMDACSVDAIVTDPPAGIAFMNKAWDKDKGGRTEWVAWMAEIARECLRVIKPGGHALVWALPRTSHWTGWAWEDAGWQPRDKVVHLFGSGFPKSADVSKAIDRRRYELEDVYRVTSWIRTARDAAGVTNAQIDAAFGFAGMAGHWTSATSQPAVPTLDQVPTLLDVLRVAADEMPDDIRRLLWDLNGLAGQPGENWSKRAVIGSKPSSLGGTVAAGLRNAEYIAEHRNKVFDVTAPATDAARQWQGWGSALKPAAEDWWLMRKPLDGTIAANVIKHGTGAINVDGCRVGVTKRVPGSPKRVGASSHTVSLPGYEGGTGHDPNVGRWPANAAFDEEAAAMLDAQTGERPSTLTGRAAAGFRHDLPRENNRQAGFLGGLPAGQVYADSGGASRFFYVAKPSRAERDAGCAELEPQQRDEGRVAGAPGGDNPRNRGASERTNSHPTVKSIALMRWLVRLITPPGGVVLDPFCGSGTTLLACIAEGVDAIGIEREAEYVEIIRRRVAHALKTPAKPTKRKPRPVAPVTPQPAPVAPTMNDMASRQLGLFDGV
jgi:hypothetical protein